MKWCWSLLDTMNWLLSDVPFLQYRAGSLTSSAVYFGLYTSAFPDINSWILRLILFIFKSVVARIVHSQRHQWSMKWWRNLEQLHRIQYFSFPNNRTRCPNLFKYLFLFSTCFGHPSAHHQEKITVFMRQWYLSLCMDGVWSAGCIVTSFNPTSPPDATRTEWQIPLSHSYNYFLLMMDTWMPETCREER